LDWVLAGGADMSAAAEFFAASAAISVGSKMFHWQIL
jgi:hypothetical protein